MFQPQNWTKNEDVLTLKLSLLGSDFLLAIAPFGNKYLGYCNGWEVGEYSSQSMAKMKLKDYVRDHFRIFLSDLEKVEEGT
jgi:hypothetical protein